MNPAHSRLFLGFGSLLCAASLFASQDPAGSVRPWEFESSDLAANPRIQFGHLENGMRFAWMANPEPQERSYVRLHVDVGALAEEDSQDGMAHFLEHMAFNGSRNFAAGTLIEWFQEHGMEFGADLNASTSFSETIYKLDLPHSDAETLKEAFTVLRDWADGLLLEQEEIDKEKGVVDGEETAGDTAGRRIFDRILEEQYPGTRYIERDVIGEREVRAAFTSDSVREFYQRWYRPEAMTLILIGDLGELDPTPLIEEAFASLAAPDRPIEPEPAIGEVPIKEHAFSIFEPEIPSVSIHLERLIPYVDEADNAAERTEDIDLACAHRMLDLRYSELAKKEGAPFLSAGISTAGGLDVYDGESLTVSCEPEKWQEAFAEAEYELRRALEFGFDQAELDEVRADWLRSLDEAVEREPTRHSAAFMRAIVFSAEERSVPTSSETERALLRPVIEALTVNDCHKALVEAWSEGVTHLYTAGNLDLGEDAAQVLRETYETSRERKVEAREAVTVTAFAYSSDPEAAGEIVSEQHIEDLDVRLITFANGVQLNVKKTDFKERQILLHSRVAEGVLTLEPEDYALGWVAEQAAVDLAGLEAHTADELRRLTAGKQVGLGFGWGEAALTFGGSTTAEDLLLELEILCAHLQHPGWRDDGLRMLKDQIPLVFERFEHTSNGPLVLEFLPELYHGDARLVELPGREAIEAVSMEAIQAWLEPQLAQGPLEVTLVGDLDLEAVKTAAAQTLGQLPARRERESFDERRVAKAPKSGIAMERDIETEDDKSFVFMVFPTDDGIEAVQRRELDFLAQVVQDRLRLEVREKLGAAYSPGAAANSHAVFPDVGVLLMVASVEPDKVATLVDAFQRVAADLKENGVTEEEVKRLSEPLIAQIRDGKRNNSFWISVLSEAQSKSEALDDVRTIESWLGAISTEAIAARAAEYLDPERASFVVVNPVSKATEGAAEAPADGAQGEAGDSDD